jgi:hypothetical protein
MQSTSTTGTRWTSRTGTKTLNESRRSTHSTSIERKLGLLRRQRTGKYCQRWSLSRSRPRR